MTNDFAHSTEQVARLVLAFALCWIFQPHLNADVQNESIGTEMVSPTFKVLRRPKEIYRLPEIIEYRVQVSWPKQITAVRLQPPEMQLENLELVRVGQEAGFQTQSEPAEEETQVFNFQFHALKPGTASIKTLSIKWLSGANETRSTFSLPRAAFQIKKPIQIPHIFLWILTPLALVSSLFAVVLYSKRKKILTEKLEPADTKNEIAGQLLAQLQDASHSLINKKDAASFFIVLRNAFDVYLKSKIEWDHSHDSKDDLFQKASRAWSEKDAKVLCGLLVKLEFLRYSGAHSTLANEAEEVCQELKLFISQKMTV